MTEADIRKIAGVTDRNIVSQVGLGQPNPRLVVPPWFLYTPSPLIQAIFHMKCQVFQVLIGGARGSRTPDLLNAIQALSQLSYGPFRYQE